MAFFCEVSFPLPLLRTFTYRLPDHLVDKVKVGSRVLAPFGSRQISGYVLEVKQMEQEPDFEVKEIISLKEGSLKFSELFIDFIKELAGKSLSSPGQLLDLAEVAEEQERKKVEIVLTDKGRSELERGGLKGKKKEILELLKERRLAPLYLRRKTRLKNINAYLKELAGDGLIEIEERIIKKRKKSQRKIQPVSPTQLRLPISLSSVPEDNQTIKKIIKKEHREYLITGSWSKRAPFISELVGYLLGKNGYVFILVPEIQRMRRWQELFGHLEELVALHSQLSPANYRKAVERIISGEGRLILGTRFLPLLPVEPVSAIIMDEEQDELYYQTEGISFDAREAARIRAKYEKAVIILTSSCPDVSSYYRHRESGTLINTGQEVRKYDYQIICGDVEKLLRNGLKDEILKQASRGQPVFIYVNKKGYAGYVQCSRCRYVPKCDSCRIALSSGTSRKELFCRYCGQTHPWPEKCPVCGQKIRAGRVRGSQFFREELSAFWSGKKILILEEGIKPSAEETIHKDMGRKNVGAVIGTEYALSRLWPVRFPLVIAVNPELGLNRPDFRAAETVFESLSKISELVANEETSRLIVVTELPDDQTIKLAVRADYSGFFDREIEIRKLLSYPPFCYLVNLNLSESRMRAAARLSRALLKEIEENYRDIEIIGPKVSRQVWHRERKEIRFYFRFKDSSRSRLEEFLNFLYVFKLRHPSARINFRVWY